jgi:ApaG protein
MPQSNDHNIIVSAISEYRAIDSNPDANEYVFSYTITIRNHSEKPAKLLSRQWIITDANEYEQTVYGDGVIGQQPYLPPGKSFEYTSAAMLPTPVGTMHGSYRMVNDDGQEFNIPIPIFSLIKPNMLH